MDADPSADGLGWVESAYRNLAPEVMRYAMRVAHGDGHLASDLTQEAFLRLHESQAPTVDDHGKKGSGRHLLNWLLNVVRQLSVNHSRRDRYRQACGDHTMEKLVDRGRAVHDQAVIREDIDRLHRMIDALPEPMREVLRLRSLGLTNPEISAAIGVDEARVRRIVSRFFCVVRADFEKCGLVDSVRRGKGDGHVDPR